MSRRLDKKKKTIIMQNLCSLFGSALFAVGFNTLIVPMDLYSGGFMGISQLLKIFLVQVLHVPVIPGMDLNGIIFFLLNIPLLYLGLRILGKEFAIRTLIIVAWQSFLVMVVPIPSTPLVGDYLTACIIGGIVTGVGTGLVLRGRASGGGQDIVGLCLAKLYPGFSVGKITIIVNIFVYGVCLALFNIEIVIYSLIYATISALAIDRVHIQSINMSVMIFTKKLGISKAIMEETGRGVTNWDGAGAYTNETSYILFVVISKYEVTQIKKIVQSIDPNAFMIFTEGCAIEGNFERRL